MEATINQEVNLLAFLDFMLGDCLIWLGIDERYIIIDNHNKTAGFGNILYCKHIYNAIESKDVDRMTPKQVLEVFEELGWLDDE